jgi:hypothetical protein
VHGQYFETIYLLSALATCMVTVHFRRSKKTGRGEEGRPATEKQEARAIEVGHRQLVERLTTKTRRSSRSCAVRSSGISLFI